MAQRIRDFGIFPGVLPVGPLNAITDVPGILVGQITQIAAECTRTGVTAILPHGGNLFQERVVAGLHVANGYGKMAGSSQLVELGELESPVVLVNTLLVGRAIEAVVDWTLAQTGNERVVSVNAVVGETNDSPLNNIRERGITKEDVRRAIETAKSGPVEEGSVGAGAGTVAYGWKAGIGTSSRRLPKAMGGWTVGVLVQANHGGVLSVDGLPVGRAAGRYALKDALDNASADGSIMVVVATDAPLSDRNCRRLAYRAMAGVARNGASFSNGFGDYAIGFSTALDVRRSAESRKGTLKTVELGNDRVTPVFAAAIEAAEEAVLNALAAANDVVGRDLLTGRLLHYPGLTEKDIIAARNRVAKQGER